MGGVFLVGAEKVVGSLLTSLLGGTIYNDVLQYAKSKGVDLERNLPEKNLPEGPTSKRPLMVTSHVQDDIVPISEMQNVLSLLEKHADKYDVESFTSERTSCGGEVHCMGVLVEPDQYLGKLCEFWKSAFSQDASGCSLWQVH